MYVIGIDPGPVVGIVVLRVDTNLLRRRVPVRLAHADAMQITAGAVVDILGAMYLTKLMQGDAIAIERFVVGSRAARSATPGGGAAARQTAQQLMDWATSRNLRVYARSASEVKPWATDERLAAAEMGLWEQTKGMRHARDAARHALFCAVKNYGLPDPLSARARAR